MKKIKVLWVMSVALLISACVATKPGPVPQYTGFLPDYAILHQGEKGQAERVYSNPQADWTKYNKILLDPVTIWRGKGSDLTGVSQADAQQMADYFYNLIYHKLAQNYKMVRMPQPNTLRISVAIVTLKEGRVILETISTIVPQARALSDLASFVTGDTPLVGKASVEAKVTDALSGALLAEGVDERIGGKTLSGLTLKSWGDVENVMKFWVDRASFHLCVKRGGTDCVAP